MLIQITVISALVCLASPLLNAQCRSSNQCGLYEHCESGYCRFAWCNQNLNCQDGEYCAMKNDASGTGTCNLKLQYQDTIDYCPGGSPVIVDGRYRACNSNNPCQSGHICNPLRSICCSALRVCQSPLMPEIDNKTQSPKVCIRNNQILPCGDQSICESRTGFCCVESKLNKSCTASSQCLDPNSFCQCDSSGVKCRCQCLTALGYTLASDGVCKRARRKLEETCTSSAECQSAFSECASGKCKCRMGFKNDNKGGCQPETYICSDGSRPLLNKGNVVTCDLKLDKAAAKDHLSMNTCNNKQLHMIDSCPKTHYCNPFYDVPSDVEHRKGFCCQIPNYNLIPKCPVGTAHSSSAEHGCGMCPPIGYFCHKDEHISTRIACCPTPCVNPSDIYFDGICYPISKHKESCEVDAQCISTTSNFSSIVENLGTNMECIRGKCECQRSFVFVEGRCIS